jgi:hypothetical protein
MVTAKINGQWHEAGYESKEEAEKVADALEQDYSLPPEDVKITCQPNCSRSEQVRYC